MFRRNGKKVGTYLDESMSPSGAFLKLVRVHEVSIPSRLDNDHVFSDDSSEQLVDGPSSIDDFDFVIFIAIFQAKNKVVVSRGFGITTSFLYHFRRITAF